METLITLFFSTLLYKCLKNFIGIKEGTLSFYYVSANYKFCEFGCHLFSLSLSCFLYLCPRKARINSDKKQGVLDQLVCSVVEL